MLSWTAAACLVATAACAWGQTAPADAAMFENQIRPLLVENCFKCHGEKKQESSLRLDSRAAILKGGEGGPAVSLDKPEESALLKAISYRTEIQMPPKKKLGDAQISLLTKWVKAGAPWPGEDQILAVRSGGPTATDRRFWSFQPVANPQPPAVRNGAWVRSPVDAFILARLEAKGLTPAAATDKRTLLRRATFDLTGLPPTPNEIEVFLADSSPEAFAKVVDRLLASTAYGERWGRHWLDVVRYADTAGETADYPVREAYKYRNYVIDSFNRDTPYDQFIREQIAGDLVGAGEPPEQYARSVVATGYIAISRRFGFDPQNYHHLTIQDTIDNVGQTFLGLSLGCARCHDHKFDPVSMSDYYALYGIFASTSYAFPGSEEQKAPKEFASMLPPAQAKQLKAEFDAERSGLDAMLKACDGELAAAKKAVKDLVDTDGAKIKQLTKGKSDLAEKRAKLLEKGAYEVAYGVTDGTGKDYPIQKRGEPTKLGEIVPRRFLEVLGGQAIPADEKGSGRLQLARWISDRRNPLTARVMVNRIWQHHFGDGLVRTESDFGKRGRSPTHPELLDFLASRFMESGWSIKSMHRLIMLGSAYQMSCEGDATAQEMDTENAMLSHFNRQRLDAESIRDSILALGGSLDRSMGGPHPFPPVGSWGFTQHNPFFAVYDNNRRSAYLMTQRLKRHPFLALFDGADANSSVAKRPVTMVPTQALFMMNDPLVHEQSAGLARQLLAAKPDVRGRVGLVFEMALGREPSSQELARATEFLSAYREQLQLAKVPADQHELSAWAAYARTILCSNEFVFVE
jgi:hypothetical protein